MLSAMVKPLADHPEEIILDVARGTEHIAFEVVCEEHDVGALVGHRGTHAKAIRLLLMRAAASRNIRVTVNILGRDGHALSPR